jgi:two-component system KDP operon response regulator KdpE
MKILLVDDDRQIVEGIRAAVRPQCHNAELLTAMSGETGLRIFFEHDPDIVLLEIALPELSGFNVLHQIRRASDVPVLIVTVRADEGDQVRGLELGPDEYVTKPCGYLALIARIRAVLRRAELLPPVRALPDLVVGDLVVNFRDRDVSVHGQRVKLTPFEFKLLYHLARNAGHLMPHDALIDRVWGTEYGHTPDHLKVFISRLRSKIERPGGLRYIETERGAGYSCVRPDTLHALPTVRPTPTLQAIERYSFANARVPVLAHR